MITAVNLNSYLREDTTEARLSVRARFRQTLKRINFGAIGHTITFTDPKTYASLWTVHATWPLAPDTALIEYACIENNRKVSQRRIKRFIPPDDVE